MQPTQTTDKTYTVPDALDGARLDKAAVELDAGLSRARVKRAIEGGAVRVNGRVRAKGAVVAAGDIITISADTDGPSDAPATPEPSAALDVVLETAAIVVVSKPAGQPTAPLRGGELGTLANALVGRFPEVAGIGYAKREPGLLHRLDTDTSGLVLAARNEAAFEELKGALKDERLEKQYLLVCASEDLPDEGTIEFPIASHPKDQRRVYPCVHPRDVIRYAPRPAVTRYEVKDRGGAWAMVEVTVAKALRHQIRAHFAAIDHPLAGDTLYGGAEVPGLGRHALHASRIVYKGGAAVGAFDVAAPLPKEMAQLLRASGQIDT